MFRRIWCYHTDHALFKILLLYGFIKFWNWFVRSLHQVLEIYVLNFEGNCLTWHLAWKLSYTLTTTILWNMCKRFSSVILLSKMKSLFLLNTSGQFWKHKSVFLQILHQSLVLSNIICTYFSSNIIYFSQKGSIKVQRRCLWVYDLFRDWDIRKKEKIYIFINFRARKFDFPKYKKKLLLRKYKKFLFINRNFFY